MGDEFLIRFFRVSGIEQDRPSEMMVAVKIEFGEFNGETAGFGADNFASGFRSGPVINGIQDNDTT